MANTLPTLSPDILAESIGDRLNIGRPLRWAFRQSLGSAKGGAIIAFLESPEFCICWKLFLRGGLTRLLGIGGAP